MTKTWKLKRTTQCAKCPWKVSTDPREIPNGYDEAKHRALRETIAKPGRLGLAGSLKVMACHESAPGDEAHCVGWLMNQLGPGNNIPLRIQMTKCENARELRTVGEQHATFEDTLRKRPKLSARDRDTLDDIHRSSEAMKRCCVEDGEGREVDREGWMRPMDFGGSNGSHHSHTATKLAKLGFVEVYMASEKRPWRSRYSGGKRYRLTDAGRRELLK